MRKLVKGIVAFREKVRPSIKGTFAELALGQKPDTLMIACSDSRVAPNVFASADPGDLFVVRNVGNLVAPCGADGFTVGDESEPAAIEFALLALKVTDIIVCGHSECGAMRAAFEGLDKVNPIHLRTWLKQAEPSVNRWRREPAPAKGLAPHNHLSQVNVLQQLEHLKTYAVVQERLKTGTLRLHAWWFDIAEAEVHSYEADTGRFMPIDDKLADRILKRLS